MANRKQYPCSTCVRTKDPIRCENKNCNPWKKWFLERWNEMHEAYKEFIKEEEANDRLQ